MPATFAQESDMIQIKRVIALFLFLGLMSQSVFSQEKLPIPYFVTYSAYMEEVGDLDIGTFPVFGRAKGINSFVGDWNEFEYGATKWWTPEFYLDWQHTKHEGSVFTGFRFENRFRPWLEPHKVNPVFYVEYEHLNAADKTLKEIVGFDSKEDLAVPNDVARHEREHEIETKLILSSDIGLWNLSENFIGVKNIHGDPWEFGYALGVSRGLRAPTGKRCTFCAERFVAGVEVYGGLGTWNKFTFRGTSQYIAPLILWSLPSETNIQISPGWGLTDQSVGTLFRIGVSQEIEGVGRQIGKLFDRH
jgi:hypothetical protein